MQLLRVCLAALVVTTYFVLAPFGYAVFTLWSLFPTRRPLARARVLQGIMRRAFVLMHDTLRQLGLLHYNPRVREGAPLPEGPIVLIANHPTLCDVTATMATFEDVTTAIKPRIYQRRLFNPLLTGAMQFQGAAQSLTSRQVIDDAVDRLRKGFRVLVFPEGTRSPPGELHPFGRTAFEIACRANVPVVPIVLTCDPPWLTKETGILGVPDTTPTYTLTTLPAVHPSDHGSSSRRLRHVVEAHIRKQLGIPDAKAAPGPRNEADARPGKPPEAPHRRVLDAGGCQPR